MVAYKGNTALVLVTNQVISCMCGYITEWLTYCMRHAWHLVVQMRAAFDHGELTCCKRLDTLVTSSSCNLPWWTVTKRLHSTYIACMVMMVCQNWLKVTKSHMSCMQVVFTQGTCSVSYIYIVDSYWYTPQSTHIFSAWQLPTITWLYWMTVVRTSGHNIICTMIMLSVGLLVVLSYFQYQWSPWDIWSRKVGLSGPTVAAALGLLFPLSVPLLSAYTSEAAQHKDRATDYKSPYASLLHTVHVLWCKLPAYGVNEAANSTSHTPLHASAMNLWFVFSLWVTIWECLVR